MPTVEELQAQIDERDQRIVALQQKVGDRFSCPGAVVIVDGVEERESCDYTAETLAAVCPTHQVHVA